MKAIEEKLDGIIQEIACKFRCEVCGKPAVCGHHFIGRKNKLLRWFLDNIIPLCLEHHTSGNFSAHLSPKAFKEYMIKKRGLEWLNKLHHEAKAYYLQCFSLRLHSSITY